MAEPTPVEGTSSLESGTEGISGGGEGEEVSRLRADNTKLRQSLADSEKLGTQAVPFVRIAQALQKAEGGVEIIEKLNKGEPLTAKEAQKAADAAVTGETPLTMAAAKELFTGLMKDAVKEFGKSVATERSAAESIKALDARAAKELEGYNDLKHDPQFQGWVNGVMEQLRAETMELPAGEKDVWWFAVKKAYDITHTLAGKPRKGKGEEERVAEALAAGGGKPSSTGAGESDIPEGMKEQIAGIRKLGTRTLAGRSFGNPRMK